MYGKCSARWQASGIGGAGTSTLPGMLGGMTWGMVLSVALYRGFFAWRIHAEVR